MHVSDMSPTRLQTHVQGGGKGSISNNDDPNDNDPPRSSHTIV